MIKPSADKDIHMPAIARLKKVVSLVALFFYAIPAFPGHVYLGSSFAASVAALHQQSPQISYASGALITDAYPLNHTETLSAVASLNGGYEFAATPWKPAIALGLGLYTTLVDYSYQGQLIETAAGDAGSALYDYHYHINSTRMMAEVQLTWVCKKLAPFINFGIGPTWNTLNNYTETSATSSGYTALPPFQSHTNLNLAYQAGLGVSTAFNFANHPVSFLQERVSLGYRYVNLGHHSFGTRGSAYPYSLNTGRFTTNDLYLSYTHLF